MSLITVFFNVDDKIVKAIIPKEHLNYFKTFGAMETPSEAGSKILIPKPREVSIKPLKADQEDDKKVVEGDLGSGEPDSIRFHMLKLEELKTFESVQDYAFKITGKMIRKLASGKLSQYRKNAVRLIRGYLSNGDQSG